MDRQHIRNVLILLCIIHSAYNRKLQGNLVKKNALFFNSILCTDHDKSFSRFAYCRLKPLNRTLKVLSLRVILVKPPVTKSHINFVFLKKANGYKPFVFNITIDICRFFSGHGNIAINWLMKIVNKYSNINHSCPYTDDMIVENLPLSQIQFPALLPDGDYRFDMHVYAFNILRATFSAFMSVSEP